MDPVAQFYQTQRMLLSEIIQWRDASSLPKDDPLRDYILHHPTAIKFGLPSPTAENPRFYAFQADGGLSIQQGGMEFKDTALTPATASFPSHISHLYPN